MHEEKQLVMKNLILKKLLRHEECKFDKSAEKIAKVSIFWKSRVKIQS